MAEGSEGQRPAPILKIRGAPPQIKTILAGHGKRGWEGEMDLEKKKKWT